MNPAIQTIPTLFQEHGTARYGVEPVTQLEHALQSASLAEDEGASVWMVTAALLHDIGHIFEDGLLQPFDANVSLNDHHEHRANTWLTEHFGPQVADPIRLHVRAKRYLCSIDETYLPQLSPTSRKSYHDQGGRMSEEELVVFERETFYRDALELRQWDDRAKDPLMKTPPLEHFLTVIDKVALCAV